MKILCETLKINQTISNNLLSYNSLGEKEAAQ